MAVSARRADRRARRRLGDRRVRLETAVHGRRFAPSRGAGMFIFASCTSDLTDAGMLDPSSIGSSAPWAPAGAHHGGSRSWRCSSTSMLGAVCFLITIPTMLPIYDRLNMDRRVLAAVASLAAGVNSCPGPARRSGPRAAQDLPQRHLHACCRCRPSAGVVFRGRVGWQARGAAVGLGGVAATGAPRRTLTPAQQQLRRPGCSGQPGPNLAVMAR